MELGWEAKHRGRVHLQDEHLMRWKSRLKTAAFHTVLLEADRNPGARE